MPKKIHALPKTLAEAEFGGGPFYSQAFHGKTIKYHDDGRNWPAEDLKKFFSEGLLQYYVGVLIGYHYNEPADSFQYELLQKLGFNPCKKERLEKWLARFKPVFAKLKQDKTLLEWGEEFQRIKQENEASYEHLRKLGYRWDQMYQELFAVGGYFEQNPEEFYRFLADNKYFENFGPKTYQELKDDSDDATLADIFKLHLGLARQRYQDQQKPNDRKELELVREYYKKKYQAKVLQNDRRMDELQLQIVNRVISFANGIIEALLACDYDPENFDAESVGFSDNEYDDNERLEGASFVRSLVSAISKVSWRSSAESKQFCVDMIVRMKAKLPVAELREAVEGYIRKRLNQDDFTKCRLVGHLLAEKAPSLVSVAFRASVEIEPETTFFQARYKFRAG